MTGSVRAAWTRLDLPTAIAISVVVQTMISLFAASIPVLAPEIAADRGWNANVIAFYPMVVFGVAFLISFRIPGLLVRMGGMGLGLACVGISAMALLILLSPYALAAALAAAAVGCATGAMNPASSQVLGPRTTARTAGLIMSIKQTGVPLGGGIACATGIRLTLARFTGLPVSAVTTLPRMTAVPTGSGGGRRPGSRGAPNGMAGLGGGGGGGG